LKISRAKLQKSKQVANSHDIAVKFTKNFHKFVTSLGDWFLDRESILEGIFYAMLCSHHVLIYGSHGTSKTEMMFTIFRAFGSSKRFHTQCTKFMTEDAIFGIANIKKMQDEGVIEYNTDEMLPEADFAFLDEMMDANDAVLRSLLDILNERIFRKGRQFLQCPLHTAVATTNFYSDSEQRAAVVDRFLIKAQVKPLSGENDVRRMLVNSLSKESKEIPVPQFDVEELRAAREAQSCITVSDEVLALLINVIDAFVVESSNKVYVSDRRKCWLLSLVKAAALLAGRMEAEPEDLKAMRFGLAMINSPEEEKWFRNSYRRLVGNYAKTRELRQQLSMAKEAVAKLRRIAEGKKTPEEKLITASKKIKSVINTLKQRDTSSDGDYPEVAGEFSAVQTDAEVLLDHVVQRVAKAMGGAV